MATTRSSATKAALARRAWSQLFDFFIGTAPERMTALARRGLTPNDSRGVHSLDPAAGRSMRSLADEWGCDASNATWIVDRLERLGLAERRPDPRDRRVKLVVLTEQGARTKTELLEEFYTPPTALLKLDRAELESLAQAMETLTHAVAESRRATSS
jgi:DNA-binding MarR family transcriptional regulator